MAEIKHNFAGGKMNKDVDERLVPNGQYRHAENIQVSTSEGSNVGTVQNLLGNRTITNSLSVDADSMCVGAISDEKNDTLYWFIREPMGVSNPRDIIFQLNNGQIDLVFVDYKLDSGGVLKFPEHIITGINIIDDMLFWTDGVNEPKKINIPRSIEGTFPNGNFHTRLINLDNNINFGSNIPIKEEHITVIKKSPKAPLLLQKIPQDVFATGHTGISQEFWVNDQIGSASGNMPAGQGLVRVNFILESDSPLTLGPGDVIVLNPQSSNILPPYEWIIELRLVTHVSPSGAIGNTPSTDQWYSGYDCEVLTMSSNAPTDEQAYNISSKVNFDYNYKNKFPRFSYRYKYEDGEYSSFAPFTEVAFEPGDFKYDVKEAFNKGMENTIKKLFLKNYKVNIPQDVNQIDLLYKESNSPVIYMIESLDYSSYWDDQIGYEVNPTSIRAALPENQMLRPWDAVPKKSLAQEVSGNRIIYGNYHQNYSLKNPYLEAEVRPRQVCDSNYGFKSLKSIRNYSLGISYLDEYGRETPVFLHKDSSFEIGINRSNHKNQVYAKANPTDDVKEWAKYCKFYIKETSNEYYNLAQDRVYDAQDGNVWLSFPSSERNKVDEETFLILKKGIEEDDDVNEKNRYKILAIENEAPEYVKTTVQYSAKSDSAPTALFNSAGLPLPTYQKVVINKGSWNSSEMPLSDLLNQAPDFATLAVRFETLVAGTVSQQTKIYDVIDFNDTNPTSQSAGEYELKLDKVIDEQYLEEDLSGNPTPGIMNPSLKILVYKKIVKNLPEFDGRFFVKIVNDTTLNTHVTSVATSSLTQVQVTGQSMPFYYVSDNDHPEVSAGTSGFNKTDSSSDWETVLKFGTGSRKNYWFVDQARYTGSYTGSHLQQEGMYQLSDISQTCDGYPSSSRDNGWNHGIWTDSSGQDWIDLSFGNLQNADSSGSLAPSWSGSTSVQKDARYQDMYDWVASNAGSYFEIGCTSSSEPCEQKKHWQVGSTVNTNHSSQMWFVQKLVQGTQFKFGGDPNANIYTITADPIINYHTNYKDISHIQGMECDQRNGYFYSGSGYWSSGAAADDAEDYFNEIHHFGHPRNRRVTYRIPVNTNPRNSTFDPLNTTNGANLTTSGAIQFLEDAWVASPDQLLTEYPAIWETEPKQDVDLDIYYEMDGAFPLEITSDTNELFAPIGSTISYTNTTSTTTGSFIDPTLNITVVGWEDNIVELSEDLNDLYAPPQYALLTFHRPNGSCVFARYNGLHDGTEVSGVNFSNKIRLITDVSSLPVLLSYYNCYSFGNGVESNRIRDDFNQVTIEKGVKASTTIEEEYKEEHRKNSLTYSGVYNSTSGVNNLNQFIAAEKITKEINPTYGSIQKLYSRNSDLVALCEDKVLKILANKDAVFNADGKPQLISTNNVLGQSMPFAGEYGISTDPASFASENYRAYFTDKVRGAVMRLSMDGLTPISEAGMKDWFRDNLKLSTKIIGNFDDFKNEYNLTLYKPSLVPLALQTYGVAYDNNKTLTFREDVKGWVSFKSFIPEYGISCSNNYYTFKNGKIYIHHSESVFANNFYQQQYKSSLTVMLNDMPGSVKSFKSINYEGTQSRVIPFTTDVTTGLTDGEYYNLTAKAGWYIDSIVTDKESGSIDEFIEKEGKWFNYIKGKEITHNNNNIEIEADGSSTFDQASFAIQGLGILQQGPAGVNIYGCTDSTQFNYNSDANTDDGSCIPYAYGCNEPNADNYSSIINTDDGSCIWSGCLDDPCLAINSGWSGWGNLGFPTEANIYNTANGGSAIVSDGSCTAAVYGCTNQDTTVVTNPNPNANVNQVSCTDTSDPCVYITIGCTVSSADNYNSSANSESGECTWYGCTDIPSPTYGQTSWSGVGFPANAFTYSTFNSALYGIQDDGSCIGNGCMDPTANNYDPAAVYDTLNPNYPDYSANTGSCISCDWSAQGTNAYTGIPITTAFQNATSSSANDGQIAVVLDPTSPYQPFVYTLTDASGNTSYTYVNNTWLNGMSLTFSILYSNLPDGTYTATITGSDPATTSFCSYSETVVVGISVAPSYGCTDSLACNFDFPADASHIDDGTCEYTTCAGCTDPLANYPNSSWTNGTSYMSQTGNAFQNTPQCIIPGTNNTGPCTISCGDGNSATDLGNWCCGYQVYGCTDTTAINYMGAVVPSSGNSVGQYDTIDDGTCNFTGCMDATATNYEPLATIACSNCCNYTPISGCTDSSYCNYDPFATIDDGTCVPGFVNAILGDPNAVDNAGNPLSLPHYFYDGVPSSSDTAKHVVVGGFPAALPSHLDIGLTIKSTEYGLVGYTNGTDKIRFQVREQSSGDPTDFSAIAHGPVDINNLSSVVWNYQSSGAVYGDRTNNPLQYVDAYPFGPGQADSQNHVFETHIGANLKKYKIEVWSEINGVEYGRRNADGTAGSTPNCGIYDEFVFTPYDRCVAVGAVSGCTDDTACNYDYQATCDDGSCYYTTNSYDWFNPNNDGSTACEPCIVGTGCSNSTITECANEIYYPDGTPTVFFPTESDCNAATGQQ